MANELDELAPKPVKRDQEFHGTLADIKATPKSDSSKPDPRLESLNRKTFF
jgi:hypothetical protein